MADFERATWPIAAGDEVTAAHFDDIRRRLFLIAHPTAGDVEWTTYTLATWDEFPAAETNYIGVTRAKYTNPATGKTSVFALITDLTDEQLWDNPPVSAEGAQNGNWLRTYDGNRYDHFSKNSACYEVIETTETGYEYVYSDFAYKWLFEDVDPFEQLVPYSTGGGTRRRNPLEVARRHVTRSPCAKRLRSNAFPAECAGNYVLDCGEPYLSEGQPRYDAMLNEALQDNVIAYIEKYGRSFMLPVDGDYTESFICTMYRTRWETGHTYTAPDYYTSLETIVWVGDSADDILDPMNRYICTQTHISNNGNKPGTEGGAAYWTPYSWDPGKRWLEMAYGEIDREYWLANASPFEAILKKLGTSYYDWYWDEFSPYIPDGLYLAEIFYENFVADPPLNPPPPVPTGCWRRCWKYTMGYGEAGEMIVMWPGENGDPPGYVPGRAIIDADEYDDIPSDFKKYYTAVDMALWGDHVVPAAWVTDYIGDEDKQAAIAARHGASQIKQVGINTVYEHEILSQILNHARKVLEELSFVDGWDYISVTHLQRPVYAEVHQNYKPTAQEAVDYALSTMTYPTPGDYSSYYAANGTFVPIGYDTVCQYFVYQGYICVHMSAMFAEYVNAIKITRVPDSGWQAACLAGDDVTIKLAMRPYGAHGGVTVQMGGASMSSPQTGTVYGSVSFSVPNAGDIIYTDFAYGDWPIGGYEGWEAEEDGDAEYATQSGALRIYTGEPGSLVFPVTWDGVYDSGVWSLDYYYVLAI